MFLIFREAKGSLFLLFLTDLTNVTDSGGLSTRAACAFRREFLLRSAALRKDRIAPQAASFVPEIDGEASRPGTQESREKPRESLGISAALERLEGMEGSGRTSDRNKGGGVRFESIGPKSEAGHQTAPASETTSCR